MTPAELQKMIDDWISYDYMHQTHDGFKGELKGKTPFEVYAQCRYVPQFVANPHSLDLLLNHVGDATVIRGSVSAGGVKYTAPELQESVWDRKRVRVFLDPADVGRATLYALDDWQQCVEAVNLDLIGRDIDPAAFRQARKDDKKVLSSFRRAARELQDKFNIDTLAAEGLAKAAAERGSLTSFVPKTDVTDNPAIQALSAAQKSEGQGYSEQELALISAQRETLEKRKAILAQQSSKVLRTEHEQAEWLTYESLQRKLTEKEQTWLTQFRNTHVMTRRRLDKILEAGKRAQG